VKNLAAKIVVTFCLLALPINSQSGGIPVFDSVNLTQNIMTAIEEIAQTIKQIEEYQTQLEQYERQIENSLNYDEFVWDNADYTINGMLGEMTSIEGMTSLVKDAAAYLATMEDGVTPYEIDDMYTRTGDILDSENQSIDELITTINSQNVSIETDAAKLVELQAKAEEGGDVGQMQALQTANMLSSHMSNQLLQLRGVLQAQSNADAALRLKTNDFEAKSASAKKAIRVGSFIPSTLENF